MWEMDPETAIVRSTWFGRTIINSACKLSYDDAQSVIEGNRLGNDIACFEFINGGNRPASSRRRTQIESSIRWFFKLSKVMRKRRFDCGALSLSNMKLSFDLDSSGMPVDCRPYAIKDSNRLIEEFMLLANMSVAARIEATFPDASLLRRHSPPLQRRLDETCQQLASAGIDIVPGSARDIQLSLDQIEDPDTRFTVESLLTAPMQRAAYFSTHSIADRAGYRHYALNVPLYTHFTSPIRRYADIIVHRTLEASLAAFGNHITGDHPLLPKLYSSFFPKTPANGSLTLSGKNAQLLLIPDSKTISDIAHQCNMRKDAAKKAQDASSKLFLVNYLAQKSVQFDTPGVVSFAIVTKVKADGFVLTVPMFGIESLIYMDRLADKHSQVQSLDGRTWKLCLWSVDASSITLIWEANSHANSVDDLANSMSVLLIDEEGQSAVKIQRSTSQERFTQTLKIFDKMAVCVAPILTPPELSVRLAMPSIY
ncbi:Translational repressor [Coemansia sp. RSA 2673]|nr:Translational repressor [Coemansia sp. RSA 2673]